MSQGAPRVPSNAGMSASGIVAQATATFLESQRDLLLHGLKHACDDDLVRAVTARHDASHEAWVSTVATLRRHASPAITDSVIELYGFHGRVAAGLAGEQSLRLDGPIETGVRRILADQLDSMTAAACSLLKTLSQA